MPKTTNAFIRRAIELQAGKGKSAPEVLTGLEDLVRIGRLKPPLPSVRTISDILREARSHPQNEIPEAAWPDSFGDGAPFPAESGRAYFELVSGLWGARPLIPLMRNYWMVTCSAPSRPVKERRLMAQILALQEAVPSVRLSTNQSVEAVELYLLAEPWKSPEAQERYARLDVALQLDLDRLKILARIEAMREGHDKAVALDIFQGTYSGNMPDRYGVSGEAE